MNDSILKIKKGMYIPINIVQERVSYATGINIKYMLLEEGKPSARKREYVLSRQISMCLSKMCNKGTLATIGWEHGKRDHATVLHACNAINDLIDSKNKDVITKYNRSVSLLEDWYVRHARRPQPVITKERLSIVKAMIKHNVNLNSRIKRLEKYDENYK